MWICRGFWPESYKKHIQVVKMSASYLLYGDAAGVSMTPLMSSSASISDALVVRAFEYHRNMGFVPSVCKYITGFLSHALLWVLFTGSAFCVDWKRLWECQECDVQFYGVDRIPWWVSSVAALALARQLRICFFRIREAMAIRKILADKTVIGDERIACMSWNEFAHALTLSIDSTDAPSAEKINMRLHRHENLVRAVALHTDHIFGFAERPWTFSASIERCLRDSMVDSLMDPNQGDFLCDDVACRMRTHLDDVFLDESVSWITVRKLKRSMVQRALWHLIILPVSIVYTVFAALAKNVESAYSQKNLVGPRHWSPWVEFMSRRTGFKETSTDASSRLAEAAKLANLVIAHSPNPIWSIVMEMIALAAGGVFAFMCLLTAAGNIKSLVQWNIGPLSFVAWFTVIGLVASGARGLVQKPATREQTQELFEACTRLFELVSSDNLEEEEEEVHGAKRHMTTEECVRAVSWSRKFLSRHYKFKTMFLLNETLSVVATPLQLLWWSRNSNVAEQIVKWVQSTSISVENCGHVIGIELAGFVKHSDSIV